MAVGNIWEYWLLWVIVAYFMEILSNEKLLLSGTGEILSEITRILSTLKGLLSKIVQILAKLKKILSNASPLSASQ